jgi:diacylglycerol O-acyltransferase
VRHIAEVQQCTVNDVVLAICAGALRRYLGHHGGVPEQALIAGIPISLREPGDAEYTTQATATRVSLATDIADPVRRLHAIRDSASAAKAAIAHTKSIRPTDFPTLGMPWLLHGLAALYESSQIANVVPMPFNLVVSNIRGPSVPLYFAGARMVGYWPVSIVGHGLGVNITVESYAGELGFGVIAATSAVRDPRQLADGLVAAHVQLLRRCERAEAA